MRNKLFLTVILVSISVAIGKAQETQTIALVGVDVFNGESSDLQNMTIIIENGIIKDLIKTGQEPVTDSDNRIELKGYYVIPGLIDTHIHMGQKGLSKSPETSRKEFRKWIYSGVTAVRDMGGDARALAVENELIKQNKQVGPDIYFSATVGSSDMIAKDLRLKRITQGIGSENAGYVIEAKPDMDIEKSVAMAVKSEVSGLKFYAGINSDLIRALTEEAHEQGLKSWAHLTVFPDRPIDIVKAGVDVVSHVWGAYWQDSDVNPAERIPFTHTDARDARSAINPKDMSVLNTDSPELQLLFKEMRERKVIWDLTHIVPNPETQKLYRKYVHAASNAGVTFSTGTDYFNDILEPYPAVFGEIESLVSEGILDPKEALLAATLNGAKAIGVEKTHGSIEKGKVANLVVLKKNPIKNITNIRKIKFTMKNGVIYYRSDYK